MAIENIGAKPVQNNVKKNEVKFNAPPLKEKETRKDGNKLLYGSLAGLAALTAVGAGIYKLKKGQAPNTTSIKSIITSKGILHEEAGCKFYFKGGKLYDEAGNLVTTTLKKESPNGRIMYTDYVDGIVTTRHFSPADKTQIKEISKTYDTKTYEGFRTIKSKITQADGNIKYAFNAIGLDRKFPPEIESKIKMKDFDNLKLDDINFDKKDLGDGVVLAKTVGDGVKLVHNGKTLCIKFFNKSGDTIVMPNGTQVIKNKNNTFGAFSVNISDEKATIFHSDGSKTITTCITKDDGKMVIQHENYDALGNLVKEYTIF